MSWDQPRDEPLEDDEGRHQKRSEPKPFKIEARIKVHHKTGLPGHWQRWGSYGTAERRKQALMVLRRNSGRFWEFRAASDDD